MLLEIALSLRHRRGPRPLQNDSQRDDFAVIQLESKSARAQFDSNRHFRQHGFHPKAP